MNTPQMRYHNEGRFVMANVSGKTITVAKCPDEYHAGKICLCMNAVDGLPVDTLRNLAWQRAEDHEQAMRIWELSNAE